MDFIKFKETEEKYRDLKDKLSRAEITPDEMKNELKNMMVLDENGSYWMIGGKSGKWYVYNGTEWKEDNPFKEKPQSTAVYTEPTQETTEDSENAGVDTELGTGVGNGAVAFTGLGDEARIEQSERYEDESIVAAGEREEEENISQGREAYRVEDEEPFVLDVTGEISTREAPTPVMVEGNAVLDSLRNEKDQPDQYTICKICKSKISLYSIYCPVCGANQKDAAAPSRKPDRTVVKENELLLASVKIASMVFFFGGLGLIIGVLWGAAFGIFKNHLPEFQPLLPDMLADTRGGIAGGLIFAAVGGIAGFTLSAFSAAVMSIIYNIIAFIFGGIRFKIKQ